MIEHIIIAIVLLGAISYLIYCAKRAFVAWRNPCKGCAGCSLRDQFTEQQIRKMHKKRNCEIKSSQKFGRNK